MDSDRYSDENSLTLSDLFPSEQSTETQGASSVVSNQSMTQARNTTDSEQEEATRETSRTELNEGREITRELGNGSLFKTIIQEVNREAKRLNTHEQGGEVEYPETGGEDTAGTGPLLAATEKGRLDASPEMQKEEGQTEIMAEIGPAVVALLERGSGAAVASLQRGHGAAAVEQPEEGETDEEIRLERQLFYVIPGHVPIPFEHRKVEEQVWRPISYEGENGWQGLGKKRKAKDGVKMLGFQKRKLKGEGSSVFTQEAKVILVMEGEPIGCRGSTQALLLNGPAIAVLTIILVILSGDGEVFNVVVPKQPCKGI